MKSITHLIYSAIILLLSVNTIFAQNDIQRVRIDFETPLGFTRHLLLGFTPDNAATDGFDYGYDAVNIENLPDDLNWLIEDQFCIIQGVGEFHTSKSYPLSMFLSNSGEVSFSLVSLENFQSNIDVYIFDTHTEIFHQINSSNYSESIMSGDYINRYYVTFTNDLSALNIENALSIPESEFGNTSINFVKNTQEIVIKTNNTAQLKEIIIYNNIAQELIKIKSIYSDIVRIPIHNLNTNSLIIKLINEDGAMQSRQIIIN